MWNKNNKMHGDDNKHNVKEMECKRKRKNAREIKCMNITQKKWNAKENKIKNVQEKCMKMIINAK